MREKSWGGVEEIEWELICRKEDPERERGRERETKLLQYAAKSMNKVFFVSKLKPEWWTL